MNRTMMRTLLALVTLFCIRGHAAQERGNGGDVIVGCTSSERPAAQFYDLFEAEVRYGMRPRFANGANVEEKLEGLIARLDSMNPGRAARYRTWAAKFFAEAQFLTGIELVDIPDTGSGFIPSGCQLKQLVVQVEPRFPKQPRYTINRDYWDLLDLNNKAAVILHELILREASLAENGHADSTATRYLNAIVHADLVKTFSLQEWIDVLRTLGFMQADADKVQIALFAWDEVLNRVEAPIEFLNASHIRKASLYYLQTVDLPRLHMDLSCNYLKLPAQTEIEFFDNRQVKAVRFERYSCDLTGGRFDLPGFQSQFRIGFRLEKSDNSYPEIIFSVDGFLLGLHSFHFDGLSLGPANIRSPEGWLDFDTRSGALKHYDGVYGEAFILGAWQSVASADFYDDGSVTHADGTFEVPLQGRKVIARHVYFRKDGSFQAFETLNSPVTVNIQGQTLQSEPSIMMSIYPSGEIRCFPLQHFTERVRLKKSDGTIRLFGDQSLYLDRNGLVESATSATCNLEP